MFICRLITVLLLLTPGLLAETPPSETSAPAGPTSAPPIPAAAAETSQPPAHSEIRPAGDLPGPSATPRAARPARVTVLGYHRFENPPRDPLAISTEEFEQQLQALKDGGVTVISMADFLAWRRGEKEIPEKSALITIDDGYRSVYEVAWPSLKKFGYPFTLFIYTKYVNVGGKSLTWEQLAEMMQGGMEIGSHTTSHANLAQRKGRNDAAYLAFLAEELAASRKLIGEKLGDPVLTLAYPYGIHNGEVRAAARAAGYEAMFTVAGRKVDISSPADELGRYIIQSGHPQIFRAAAAFGPEGTERLVAAPAAYGPQTSATTADPGLPTRPANGGVTTERRPVISADLSSLGPVAADSLEMRVSGHGIVPVVWDEATRTATAALRGKINDQRVMVTLSGTAGGRKFNTAWSFQVEPAAAVPEFPAAVEMAAMEKPATAPAPAQP